MSSDIPSASAPKNYGHSLEFDIIEFNKRQQKAFLQAKMLLSAGSDISFVAQATGLSIETIMKLMEDDQPTASTG